MQYQIDESDLERQRILAQTLKLFSREVIEQLLLSEIDSCLDIGCGVGETTRFLCESLKEGTEIVGLDADANLLKVAAENDFPENRTVSFREGSAYELPFDDESFDMVHVRYLLCHLEEPVNALKEMFRVCKTNGVVVTIEPDFTNFFSIPPSEVFASLPELWNRLFIAKFGRQLPALFAEVGHPDINFTMKSACSTDSEMKDCLKKLVVKSLQGTRAALVENGWIGEREFSQIYEEVEALCEEPASYIICGYVASAWALKEPRR